MDEAELFLHDSWSDIANAQSNLRRFKERYPQTYERLELAVLSKDLAYLAKKLEKRMDSLYKEGMSDV